MTEIFVFGSNLAGRHGAGSALEAVKNHGAVYGIGHGIQGHSYAIPTKDWDVRLVLDLPTINRYVDIFVAYAYQHPEHTFKIVKIGCGLAGYREDQIKPMFKDAPSNCILPEGWRT